MATSPFGSTRAWVLRFRMQGRPGRPGRLGCGLLLRRLTSRGRRSGAASNLYFLSGSPASLSTQSLPFLPLTAPLPPAPSAQLHPEVAPQVSHLEHEPLRTSV